MIGFVAVAVAVAIAVAFGIIGFEAEALGGRLIGGDDRVAAVKFVCVFCLATAVWVIFIFIFIFVFILQLMGL